MYTCICFIITCLGVPKVFCFCFFFKYKFFVSPSFLRKSCAVFDVRKISIWFLFDRLCVKASYLYIYSRSGRGLDFCWSCLKSYFEKQTSPDTAPGIISVGLRLAGYASGRFPSLRIRYVNAK